MDSGHIQTRRSTIDFDYILDEPIILEDDEAVTVKLGYLSLKHDFQHNHSHIKIDETNNKFNFKHACWVHSADFPFRIDMNYHQWKNPDSSTLIISKVIPSGSYTKLQIAKAIKDIIEKEMNYVSWLVDDGRPEPKMLAYTSVTYVKCGKTVLTRMRGVVAPSE